MSGALDPAEVTASLGLDAGWLAGLRANWLELMEVAVFGDLRPVRITAGGRMRRRVLELGERLRSLGNDRGWIPHPREQLKNALASALAVRDGLRDLAATVEDLQDAGDRARFAGLLARLEAGVDAGLRVRELRWAELLDRQYRDQEPPA